MPKRFNEELQVTVYKYDLIQPLNWGPDCDDELRRQNDLWNTLCMIEREHVEKVRAIAAPAASEVETRATQLAEHLNELFAERAKLRKDARRKIPTPEIDAEVEKIKPELKTLRAQAKEQRQEAYAANKEPLKLLDTERFERVKKARQESAALGSYWGNYNSVINSYERARNRSVKIGVELKQRPFNGEGRLTNQIQNGMTAGRVLANTHSLVGINTTNVMMLRPRGGSKLMRNPHAAILRFNIFNHDERRYVNWPFIMYRPLPDDAMIKEVVVTKRRHANTWRWSVIFTMTKAKPKTGMRSGQPVAINFGWRRVEDELRVGTAVRFSTDPRVRFEPPAYTMIPAGLMQRFVEYEKMQSERSTAKNTMITALKPLFAAPDIPLVLKPIIDRLQEDTVIKTGTLIYLYETWIRNVPDWSPHLRVFLHDWWQGSGHHNEPLWKSTLHSPAERFRIFGERGAQTEQANRRRGLDNARLYFYRLEARRLVGDAAVVIINQHNMANTARKEGAILPPPARRNRFIAAPSLLRQAILNYCRNNDIEVLIYNGKSSDHAVCGTTVEMIFPDEVQQLCTNCLTYFDVDENFCRVMLNRTAVPPRAKAA